MQKSARAAGWRCFQGDSVSVRVPRPEGPTPQSLRRGTRFQDAGAPKRSEGGLGCSVFALWAIENVHKKTSKIQRALLAAPGVPRVAASARSKIYSAPSFNEPPGRAGYE
jgi:hypothetical protein